MTPYAGPSVKQLVAHRGACAYAPEHTLQSYRLALDQHADFVEQEQFLYIYEVDVVFTDNPDQFPRRKTVPR